MNAKEPIQQELEHGIERVYDRHVFQRRARLLQAIWRCEKEYPIGKHHQSEEREFIGCRLAMPWARKIQANYLDEEIRAVVCDEVLNPEKNKGKVYTGNTVGEDEDKYARIWNDLLSSQPLCFNLFAHLKLDLPLASKVFGELSNGRISEVTAIEFEYSPGRGDDDYTGDGSAFDVYIEFDNSGRGFCGIEVKYHETLARDKAKVSSRYEDVAKAMNCFKPSDNTFESLRRPPIGQIWRNHLLAGAMLQADDFMDGFHVMAYPKDNTCCAKAIEKYRGFLTNEDTFVVWTLEDITEAIMRNTNVEWIKRFHDRYLAFEKIAS